MNNFNSRTLLYMISMCLVQRSCNLFDFQPEKFESERYRRSRAWPVNRPLDPVREFNQVLDFMALVNQFGYPAEEHLLKTIDGYKLRLHRIPGSPLIPKAKGKPVVYFQHGILTSSDSWVLRGPNKDFAYILADAGFDVWFGNIRGNTYSRAHISLSPKFDPAFWNFSWQEAALYDLTSIIDYILAETGREQLVYIGHSMGTTMSYVLLSMRPEYNKRIELVISLAPSAFWHGHLTPFSRFLTIQSKAIKNFLYHARVYELFPRTNGLIQLLQISCAPESAFQPLCLRFYSFVVGHNPKELNATMVPYYFSYLFSGCSRKTLILLLQNMKSGDFHMYDYGATQNMIIYNAETPPRYNLSNIVAPVAIFYGRGDGIISQEDVLELAQKLPNVLTVETVSDEKFSHLDFMLANNLKILLLDRLMEIIRKVTRNKSHL